MAKKSSKQRQKARQRKLAKRVQKRRRRSGGPVRRYSSPAQLRAAAEWPLMECLVTEDWQEPGKIVQVLVARSGPRSEIALALVLVDLGCLGVKDAFGRVFASVREYRELLEGFQEEQTLVPAELNLAAKIIHEAIAYADQFGFKPHRDYRDAMPLLGGADPDASDVPIPLGQDGKPFFVAGPFDDVRRIMTKLERAVGPDGFHYIVPVEPIGSYED